MHQMDADFIPIEIGSLVTGTMTGFDLYIDRKSGSKVLYRGGSIPIEADVFRRLRENENEVLYINHEDWDKYQLYLEANLQSIVSDESVPVERRCQIVYTTATHIMQQVFEDDRTAESVKRAEHIISPTVSMILSGEEALRNMIHLTSHDYYTYTHSVNVCVFATALATKVCPDMLIDQIERLGQGFLLHDIGKSKIAPEIINKDGPLTAEEWKIMRQHPELGHDVISEAEAMTEEVAVIVLQHHERFDGTGYPDGLIGSAIPLPARILTVADVFDALTSSRPWREAMTVSDALALMEQGAGSQFDPEVLNPFLQLVRQYGQAFPEMALTEACVSQASPMA